MTKKRRRSPIIHLDEIDVIQMAYAAIEMFPRETLGLLLGSRSKNQHRRGFYIHFVHILQRGKREKEGIDYPGRFFKQFLEKHNFEIIGDFHSHPSPLPDGADVQEKPSRLDLKDISSNIGFNAVMVIIYIKKLFGGPNKTDRVIIRRRNKISCFIHDFEIRMNFFAFPENKNAVVFNKQVAGQIRRVLPKCRLQKKKMYRKTDIVLT